MRARTDTHWSNSETTKWAWAIRAMTATIHAPRKALSAGLKTLHSGEWAYLARCLSEQFGPRSLRVIGYENKPPWGAPPRPSA